MTNLKDKRILLTGGSGFLGQAIVRRLSDRGVSPKQIRIPRSADCDLRVMKNCEESTRDVGVVIHLAAKVGGIGYNQTHPAELFYDNLIMGTQLMESARREGVEKYIAVGTVCAYPKLTPVPFREEFLWDGYPEETNAPYGLAKKMALVQAQSYRSQYGFNAIYLLPVNLYGPGDNFDPQSSHVIPALIRRVVEAKKKNLSDLEVWGTGSATREFLYVDDAAEGIVLAAERYDGREPINIGSGHEISIKELVKKICHLVDYRGQIKWDTSRPDGQPRRRLDISRAQNLFGYEPKTDLDSGLKKTIKWYLG